MRVIPKVLAEPDALCVRNPGNRSGGTDPSPMAADMACSAPRLLYGGRLPPGAQLQREKIVG